MAIYQEHQTLRDMIQHEAGRYAKARKAEQAARKKANEAMMERATREQTLRLLKRELRRLENNAAIVKD